MRQAGKMLSNRLFDVKGSKKGQLRLNEIPSHQFLISRGRGKPLATIGGWFREFLIRFQCEIVVYISS